MRSSVSPWGAPVLFVPKKDGLGGFTSRTVARLFTLEVRPTLLERIGPVEYRLALPPSRDRVQDVFYASVLRKYLPDPSHVISATLVVLREDLSFEETSVRILAQEEKRLR